MALTLSLVACSDVFSGGDCRSSRTCAASGGQGGDASDDTMLGESSDAPGGAAGAGGASGAGGARDTDCDVAKDCSNDDPSDGEEACDNGYCVAGNPPPTVVSVSPADEAEGVEPDAEIVIEFSEALDPESVNAANIQLLDGDEPVAGELSHEDNKVVFKPEYPLGLLAQYDVSVSTNVTDADGAPLLEAFASTLAVRDGAWVSVMTDVAGPVSLLSDTLPITEAGNALIAWVAFPSAERACPTTAQWFNRGEGLGTPTSLTSEQFKKCSLLHASVAATGDALVTWHEDTGAATGARASRYKDGAWAPKAPVSGTKLPGFTASAIGPDGVSHHIETNLEEPGTYAYVTDASGKWSAAPFTLSDEVADQPQVVVAKNGNALAAWPATDAINNRQKIVFASYSPDQRAWAKATTLAGSIADSTGAGFERSPPSIAMNAEGDAMMLWVADSKVMASRLPLGSAGWTTPASISGNLQALLTSAGPALAFDGKTFVAAWTTAAGAGSRVYVARYDAGSGAWGAYQPLGDASSRITKRMPQLRSDAHQNLLLVWPTALQAKGRYRLVSQRFFASTGTWQTSEIVTNVTDLGLAGEGSLLPFSVNRGGVAALAWGTAGGDAPDGGYSKLSLARFH